MSKEENTYLVDDLHVNGKRLTLVGILHSKEEFTRNMEAYEHMIRPYTALMLEQPLWYPDFSFDQSSFGQLAAIAMRMNKKVYIADPLDSRVLAADAGFCVAGLSLAVKGGMDAGRRAINRTPAGFTRKKFILRLGMLALGAPLFLGSLPGLDLRSAIDREGAYEYGLDDQITWGSKDWRDLWIAMGMEKVMALEDIHTLAAFHGVGHQQGILHYLTHPEDRRREAAYLPFKKISSNLGVREWTPKKYKWELARVF